ncbi:MAG: SAM-dependent methyltransferase, partial [Oscillospiraceae bacterium]
SYGRGPSGEVWRLEENLWDFVKLVSGVLSDDPIFFLISSYTTGLAPSVLSYLLDTLVTPNYGGHTESDELGLRVSANNLVLPCGAAGRWTRDK